MIEIIFCLRRVPKLSRAEFQEYWRHEHGPRVLQRAAVLRFASYEQLHTIDIPDLAGIATLRGGPLEYDGIAQARFATVEDLLITRRDPRAAQAARELLEDEKLFIDHSRSPIFVARRDVVIGA